MAVATAIFVSNRLQRVTMALFCLMAAQMVVASCTPEPVPYATRVAVMR